MNLTHGNCSLLKDSITSRINWRARNSGQVRTGTWSHGTQQVATQTPVYSKLAGRIDKGETRVSPEIEG